MSEIVYTCGEPAGIGPDIIIQLAHDRVLESLVCIGDSRVLTRRAEQLKLPLILRGRNEQVTDLGQLKILDQPLINPRACNTPDIANAESVLKTLDTAVQGCIDGKFSAMVTGPLHKGVINDAGIAFSGHTEYLAQKTNTPLPVMLLASSDMRVALMTTHLPLSDVSAAITQTRIKSVCRVIHQDLKAKFDLPQPKLLVCGLNPHAGEGGHLGREELDTIIPALNALREEGLDIQGPLPADTLFTPRVLAMGDIAVAMYHDQGLPVLKHQSFGRAANITLGLPIIRTSVDHGTALDIAGSGTADTGSLIAAIEAAVQLATGN